MALQWLGCLGFAIFVGFLKYVSIIAEGRALEETIGYKSFEALFSTVLDGDPRPRKVRAVD